MTDPIKIDRKLPPHELNARRRRKRNVTRLPGLTPAVPEAAPKVVSRETACAPAPGKRRG